MTVVASVNAKDVAAPPCNRINLAIATVLPYQKQPTLIATLLRFQYNEAFDSRILL
jgi:hypothetical protein